MRTARSAARADLLLQTLETHDGIEVARRRLELSKGSMRPVVFEPTLALSSFALAPVTVGVVVLSVGAGIVLNSLTVAPGDRTHNFQVCRQLEGLRRREFHVASAELALSSGFWVLDVDRVLKSLRIAEQVDFAHFPESRYPDIAAEGVRILREMEVL